MTATRIPFRFAGRGYTAMIEEGTGRVLASTTRDRARLGGQGQGFEVRQAAKAAISAICELEELQAAQLQAVLAGRAPSQAEVARVAGRVPESVLIEGGKYEFRSGRVLSDGYCLPTMRRGSESWIDVDELEHPRFWFALAGALQDARAVGALLEDGAAAADQEAAAL